MNGLELCFSDLHFGRLNHTHEQAVERNFVDAVERHGSSLRAVYLVGDVYDIYLEYARSIPARVPRFLGLLCNLIDANIPVYYLIGNRDAWHRRFFSEEVGVQLIKGSLDKQCFGHQVHFRHGDKLEAHTSFYRRVLPLIQSSALLNALEYGLPGDLGLQLAENISRKKRRKRASQDLGDAPTAVALAEYASQLIAANKAELVVMGHSHIEALSAFSNGIYLNCGFWNGNLTYGQISASGVQLLKHHHGILKEIHWKSKDFSLY